MPIHLHFAPQKQWNPTSLTKPEAEPVCTCVVAVRAACACVVSSVISPSWPIADLHRVAAGSHECQLQAAFLERHMASLALMLFYLTCSLIH